MVSVYNRIDFVLLLTPLSYLNKSKSVYDIV